MNDWTRGYVADVGYTFGYYPELNPLYARLVFANAGLAVPQNLAACELGFGQGISVNVHAAAGTAEWFANDFNPSQANFAQHVARATGNGAALDDASFEEFCHRQDLPDFDFIGLHGIWSWVDQNNCEVILDFVARKLKVGGILYISYNTEPGWAPFTPVRNLMLEHRDHMGSGGSSSVEQFKRALAFAGKVAGVKPSYMRANPGIERRLEGLQAMDPHYLVHEYFNRNWNSHSFSDVNKHLSEAKLSFACPANPIEHIDALNLTADQQQMLAEIEDGPFRQVVRDFIMNTQFRKDYWVKGVRKLQPVERLETLREHRVILCTPPSKVSLQVSAGLGMVDMRPDLYEPLLDALADFRPCSLGELECELAPHHMTFAQILECVLILSGTGALAAVQEDGAIAACRANAKRFNLFMLEQARLNANFNILASPLTGGGIVVPRYAQLFLQARALGRNDPAAYAWEVMAAQGQRLLREGVPIESDAESIAVLEGHAAAFAREHLPMLIALEVTE